MRTAQDLERVPSYGVNLPLIRADVRPMRVTPDYIEPRRAWWLSFWFAVLAILAVVGGIAYVAYLIAPAIASEVA